LGGRREKQVAEQRHGKFAEAEANQRTNAEADKRIDQQNRQHQRVGKITGIDFSQHDEAQRLNQNAVRSIDGDGVGADNVKEAVFSCFAPAVQQVEHAQDRGEPSVIYGNVRNDGLIDNLPQGSCVEVACLVDANGIQPTKVGAIPSHLAAMMQTNINVQMLLTEAILTENRDRVYHAAMLDPHTAAVLGIEEIYALVDDLIAAHGDWLPAWLHRE